MPTDRTEQRSAQTPAAAATALRRLCDGSLTTIALAMGLFGLAVAGIPYLGLDLAIFFFVIATLWLFGERRVLFALSLAGGIAVALCAAAAALLTIPIPLAIARSLWSGI